MAYSAPRAIRCKLGPGSGCFGTEQMYNIRRLLIACTALLLVTIVGATAAAAPAASANTVSVFLPLVSHANNSVPPLVFVSRQIPPDGSIYWNVPKDMPGVGTHSR